ncbi:MAG: Stealth CR1 domain-containing protein [Bacteroidetes bacterium]|nr:Stealth CR1 domain-containing protein [Bacteroidota bacterium]
MTGNIHTNHTTPIDAVITWVDGSDPQHIKKMSAFLKETNRNKIPGAHQTRFASVNEIKYCLLSILKFAPFVRNIFIITDNQDPQLHNDIKKFYPERITDIKIIDHKEIFAGFEKELPTFSSRSIETIMWRINDLSDNFIYFNDDTFLIRETKRQDWFADDKPVLLGRWHTAPWLRVIWQNAKKFFMKYIIFDKTFQPRASYHMGQWQAAKIAGYKTKYFCINHTPFALRKETAENFFNNNREIIAKNIIHKFKNHNQFNFISLLYHLELKNGGISIKKPDVAYLQPFKRHKKYVDNKIALCKSNENIKFLCVQSLDICTQEDIDKVFSWLEDILELKQ